MANGAYIPDFEDTPTDSNALLSGSENLMHYQRIVPASGRYPYQQALG